MSRNYHKGVYEVINLEKYRGAKFPTYRSRWEQYVYRHFDLHPSVLEWHVEPVRIPYTSQVKGRNSHYIPDVYAKVKTKDGGIEELLIEIKPKSQTIPPKKGNKKQKTLLEEQLTYQNNLEKWEAAKSFCNCREIKFMVITEEDIFK